NFVYHIVPSTACDPIRYDPATLTFSCASYPLGTVSGTTGTLAVFTGTNAVGNSSYGTTTGTGIRLTGTTELGTAGRDYFNFSVTGLTGKGAVDVSIPWRGATGVASMAFTCGTLTNAHIVSINADGCLTDGGTAGAGTWTDTSVNTRQNKTFVATGAGG